MDVVLPQERHLRPAVPDPDVKVIDAPAWLEAERRNLLAVAAHATRHGWPDHLRLLSGILWHYLDVGGYHEESLVLHSHASALAHDAGDRVAEAEPLILIALGHWRVGRSREARRYLEEALVLARETGDRRTEIHSVNTLGLVCRALGRFAEGDRVLDGSARADPQDRRPHQRRPGPGGARLLLPRHRPVRRSDHPPRRRARPRPRTRRPHRRGLRPGQPGRRVVRAGPPRRSRAFAGRGPGTLPRHGRARQRGVRAGHPRRRRTRARPATPRPRPTWSARWKSRRRPEAR